MIACADVPGAPATARWGQPIDVTFIRESAEAIADVVNPEYFGPAVASRAADAVRQHLEQGRHMTTKDFRRIALALGEAVEGAHMNHPDFRVHGRIFATIKPDGVSGMVALPPDDQRRFVSDHPESFEPEAGAWGRQGCTRVHLPSLDEEMLGEAMTLAWQFARHSVGRKRARAPAARRRVATDRKASVKKRR